MTRGAQDYVILEAHMDATAKLLDARTAVDTALAASRRAAGLLEAQAMQRRQENRQERGR